MFGLGFVLWFFMSFLTLHSSHRADKDFFRERDGCFALIVSSCVCVSVCVSACVCVCVQACMRVCVCLCSPVSFSQIGLISMIVAFSGHTLFIWVSGQQNLSSGISKKLDSNQSAQLQRLARNFFFYM